MAGILPCDVRNLVFVAAVREEVAAERDMVVVATAEVAHSWVVAAIAEMASVVDIGVEVVRIFATVELTPRMYFVVAIVVVDIPG
jgi:hypothetical protein